MRYIVTGGRNYTDRVHVFAELNRVLVDEGIGPIEVVATGDATGVDDLVREWCRGHKVSYRRFAADWHAHGKSAGPRRNRRMLTEIKPGMVVAFPGGRGTADMVRAARGAHVEVVTVEAPKKEPQ
jgi:hypothetical protein